MTPTEYLKKPYARVVRPEDDGTWFGEVLEFPGCFAVGDTASDALANLDNVAESWLIATMELGQNVPDPIDETAHESFGRVVRRSLGLSERATMTAVNHSPASPT